MKKYVPFGRREAEDWRREYCTPFYVYDGDAIRARVRGICRAFSWNKGFKECFAVKALPTPAIIRLLREEGCGTDCASVSEVVMSTLSGVSGESIMFTSNETSFEAYRKAYEAGAVINLDDITQIEVMEKALDGKMPETVCLRFNPGQFAISSSIMGHLYDSKFGMTEEQLYAAYALLKEKGVKKFGLHAMLSSCSLDSTYYEKLSRVLFNLVVAVKEKTGVEITLVDLAGGVGIPYREEEDEVDIAYIGESVRRVYEEILTPRGMEVTLYTEMGRYVTGPCGYLVTSVRGTKDTYRHYLGVDATACDLMRPAMYGAYHHITVLGKEEAEKTMVYDVVGGLCENNDKFAVERPLPKCSIGDILVIHDSGAHGRSMGYNYNGMLRAGELLLEKGEVKMVRRGESLADLFATFSVDEDFHYDGE